MMPQTALPGRATYILQYDTKIFQKDTKVYAVEHFW